MLAMLGTKSKRNGLTKSNRIDWKDPRVKIIVQLALYGFHGELIAEHSELTRAQVYNRLYHLGIQLRDYRDGKTDPARPIIKKYSIKTITPKVVSQLEKQVITPIKF